MDAYMISSVLHVSTLIKGIQSYNFDPALQSILLSGSGAVDPTFAGVVRAEPKFTFSSVEIKKCLANLGANNGIAVNGTNMSFWMQKTVSGGLRASGANHIRADIAAGIVVPQTLRATLVGEAVLEYLVTMISADGMTAPVMFTSGFDLHASEGGADQAYTLGQVQLNGTNVDAFEVVVNFGLSLLTSGGRAYPTHVFINRRRPSIVINTYEVDLITTLGLTGTAQTESDSVIQFDNIEDGGGRGSSPIAVSVDAGRLALQPISGNDGERLGTSILITPTYDGSNDILAWSGLT
ncbi:MAG: hypothetical protein JXA82_18115 [Sedimentisphaerales bacterium]|nr:hypothetical protein [Sedimentisphaerales bacterium]